MFGSNTLKFWPKKLIFLFNQTASKAIKQKAIQHCHKKKKNSKSTVQTSNVSKCSRICFWNPMIQTNIELFCCFLFSSTWKASQLFSQCGRCPASLLPATGGVATRPTAPSSPPSMTSGPTRFPPPNLRPLPPLPSLRRWTWTWAGPTGRCPHRLTTEIALILTR